MNKIENILSDAYKKEYSYFTGNGTTALYLIFKALNIKNKKVVFPNITCMAPVNAAIYAGYEVLFCDINIDDFTFDLKSFRELVSKEEIGICVPTHIYGHICNMEEIYNFCKEKNIVVIEDAAQTTEISDYNDFAITSFGHTKIFETIKGGGAIFFKDNIYEEYFKYYSKNLNIESNNKEFKDYATRYYDIANNLSGEQYYKQMRKLQLDSKDVFLRHFKQNDEIISVLKEKHLKILGRLERAEMYKKYLEKDTFIFPKESDENSKVLWRLTLLTKNIDRDKFIDEIRKQDVDISSWYPCLHRVYNDQKDIDLKNSIYISEKIVNFWITEKYKKSKISEDIVKINSVISSFFGR